MTFTDDDLTRLKERIGEDPYASKYVDCVEYEQLMALLTRLEDSERDRDYWKARCMSAEESSSERHLELVRSGFFMKRKAGK